MTDDVLLTLAEAADRLDPPISRRTLERLAEHLEPAGTRRRGRGRPARLYRSADLDRLHAAWVRGEIMTRRHASNRGPSGVQALIVT